MACTCLWRCVWVYSRIRRFFFCLGEETAEAPPEASAHTSHRTGKTNKEENQMKRFLAMLLAAAMLAAGIVTAAATDGWVTDRTAPKSFELTTHEGESCYALTVNPEGTQEGFYRYQGCQYPVSSSEKVWSVSTKLYVDSTTYADNVSFDTGVWLAVKNSEGSVNGYPLIGFRNVPPDEQLGWYNFDDVNGGWSKIGGATPKTGWNEIVFSCENGVISLYINDVLVKTRDYEEDTFLGGIIFNSANYGNEYTSYYTEPVISSEAYIPAAGVSSDEAPSATDNAANGNDVREAIAEGETAEVKLHNGSAGLAVSTMSLLGDNDGASLTVSVGDMTVSIPGGYGEITEPGRIYYPMDYASPSPEEDAMADLIGDAEFETVKAGAPMKMPTAVTVTLDTDLEGTIHIYRYDEDTSKLTYVTSVLVDDSEITFTTIWLGHFLLTNEKL